MSFSLGLTGSKSNSKGSSDSTTTAIIPDWITDQTKGIAGGVAALGAVDPHSYVAGADPLQTQAAGQAGTLGANTAGMFDKASGSMQSLIDLQTKGAPQISAASLLDGLDKYQNPFQQQVIDTSAADFDHQAGINRAQETLDMAGAGAFGGSGAALTRSMSTDNSERARASLLSGLRSQGFDTATALSGQDAARRQEADTTNAGLKMQNRQDIASNVGQLAGMAGSQDANSRANIDSMFTTGSGLRAIDQQDATSPLDLQAWMASTFGSLPTDMFAGSHTVGTTKGSGTTIGASASAGRG